MWKVLMCFFVLPLAMVSVQGQETRLENAENKTILVFTPHPDDDVFGAGGTIALLNRNHTGSTSWSTQMTTRVLMIRR
jgi:hypothetical protein